MSAPRQPNIMGLAISLSLVTLLFATGFVLLVKGEIFWAMALMTLALTLVFRLYWVDRRYRQWQETQNFVVILRSAREKKHRRAVMPTYEGVKWDVPDYVPDDLIR